VTQAALDEAPAEPPQDLAVLYQRLLELDQLAGFEVLERFYEIGSFEGLEQTRALLASMGARSGGGGE